MNHSVDKRRTFLGERGGRQRDKSKSKNEKNIDTSVFRAQSGASVTECCSSQTRLTVFVLPSIASTSVHLGKRQTEGQSTEQYVKELRGPIRFIRFH
ncbi:hypothetical protein AVEN_54334-1 [Araneus ventricosus]|uniref:Uncharacterized protein n=1 Tax=Araneus ventricosus TaxID=182803 RepID=A0A4Y2GDP0_ARAVE|nr:hypothetical protein AVEN_54334-1 [Araneus ventricosus]